MYRNDVEHAAVGAGWSQGSTGCAPGKRTLTAQLQCRMSSAPPASEAAPATSGGGGGEVADPFWFATGPAIAGGGAELPHLPAVQRAFGHHDVGGIAAHVGGDAARGAAGLGAEAYATGNHVAFAAPPDLHTAAHEAAHVVQQRAGVQLKGGLGEAGDVYERHADEVADAVVRGEPAGHLLDRFAGGGGGDGSAAVQRKYKPDAELEVDQRDAQRFDDFFGGYIKVLGPEVDGRQLVEELASGRHWIYDRGQDKYEPAVAPRGGAVEEAVEDEAEASGSEESSEEDDETIDLFHGTDLKTATKLAAKKTAIKAQGKGELGGGFYMTHDLHQAAHIADLYCAAEARGSHWAVVRFTVQRRQLCALVGRRKLVTRDAFPGYHAKVKEAGNAKESRHAWTVGPIKDNTTPYMQHLFAQEGLAVLNHDTTERQLVLQGQIGVEKDKYLKGKASRKYEPEEDEALTELLELEEPEESSEGEDDAYEELAAQVAGALAKQVPQLTKAVLKRLQAAFEEEEDERYLTLMKKLQ